MKKIIISLLILALSGCALVFEDSKTFSLVLKDPGRALVPTTSETLSGSRVLLPSYVDISVQVTQAGEVIFEDRIPYSFDYSGDHSVDLVVTDINLDDPVEIQVLAFNGNNAVAAAGQATFYLFEADIVNLNLIPEAGAVQTVGSSAYFGPNPVRIKPSSIPFLQVGPGTTLSPNQWGVVAQDGETGEVVWSIDDIADLGSYVLYFDPGQELVISWIPKYANPTGPSSLHFYDPNS